MDLAIYTMIGSFILLVIALFRLKRNYNDSVDLLEVQLFMIEQITIVLEEAKKELERAEEEIKKLEERLND